MPIRPKSIPALLQAVRVAKSNPHARFSVPGDFDLDAGDVLRLWRRGVDARASRGLPQLSPEKERAFLDLQWDSARINEYASRVRHSGCRNLLRHPAMKRRYPHIDNQPTAW